MGTKCNYFSTMKAMSSIDLPLEEKTWLQHYGDMPEHMCYREGSIYELLKEMVIALKQWMKTSILLQTHLKK